MLSVEEAQRRILAAARPTPAEQISLADAHGRVLAEDIAARRTQPPKAVSAMDGWPASAKRGRRNSGLPVGFRAACKEISVFH